MIDHVTISVNDLTKSKIFYEKILSCCGYHLAFGEEERFWAFNIGNGALFEIAQYAKKSPLTSSHVAFRAKNEEEVEQFYKAGIAAGGKCNGAPGLRLQYTPTYYAAFILDPDGHNIEMVYHQHSVSENNFKKILDNNLQDKPITMSILMRKLNEDKSYQDFREAWLPRVSDPSLYFDIPIVVINGQNVQNLSEIVSIALVWADVQKAITSYQQKQISEDLREEKISKVTQQSVETRFCSIIDIDVLGS